MRVIICCVIAIFCCMEAGISQSQVDSSDIFMHTPDGDGIIAIADSNNIPYGHYVTVGQYFDHTAALLRCGEITLRRLSGDSINLYFDNPQKSSMLAYKVNVYQTNSLQQCNPIVSRAFRFSQGDSLYFYREAAWEVPMTNPDSSERTFEQDTTEFDIPDSVRFDIKLIDASTDTELVIIENMLFTPTDQYWSALDYVFPRDDFETMKRGAITSWAVPMEYLTDPERWFRIKVDPVYLPQLTGRFNTRAIFAEYSWSPRISEDYKKLYSSLMKRSSRLRDSLFVTHHIDNSTLDLEIYPTVVSVYHPTITLSLNSDAIMEGANVWLVGIDGRVYYEKILSSQNASGDSFELTLNNMHDIPRGPYFVFCIAGKSAGGRLLIVK